MRSRHPKIELLRALPGLSTRPQRKPRLLLAASTVSLAVLLAACHPFGLPHPQEPWCDGIHYHYPTCVNRPTVPSIPRLPTTTTTAPDTTAPSAENLVATTGDGQIRLDWAPSSDAGGSGVAGYRVHRSDGDGTFEVVGATTGTTYTDGGLRRGKKYSYFVTAYDGAGNESSPSTTVTARSS